MTKQKRPPRRQSGALTGLGSGALVRWHEFLHRIEAKWGSTVGLETQKHKYEGLCSDVLFTVKCLVPEHPPVQLPAHRLAARKHFCRDCSNCFGSPLTFQEWWDKAHKRHGWSYDLSPMKEVYEFRSSKNVIKLKCPKLGHGEFQVTATQVLERVNLCTFCTHEAKTKKVLDQTKPRSGSDHHMWLPDDEYINRLLAQHGAKFEFLEVVRRPWKQPKIRYRCCRGHEDLRYFGDLMKVRQCPKCYHDPSIGKDKITLESRIELAKNLLAVHHPKLEFVGIEQIRGLTRNYLKQLKVKVRCPDHGSQSIHLARLVHGEECQPCHRRRVTWLKATRGISRPQAERLYRQELEEKSQARRIQLRQISIVAGLDNTQITCEAI